ncbi:MAG: substrate-binding domain-containing protein [Aquificaceae bacterium]
MNKVKDYRIRLGLSQEELSQITGIPRTTISSIESGRVLPSVDYAIRLARAFKCSVEELFTQEEYLPFPGFEEGLFTSYRVENKRILIPISLVEEDKAPEGYYKKGKIGWFYRKETITYAFAGCDPSLSVFSNLAKEEGIRLLVINTSSLGALDLLKKGFAHMAGMHMGSFEDNLRVAKRILGKGYKLLKLFSWEEGVILRKGLDKSLKGLKDKLWLAREKGSGARRIFDYLRKDLGIENYKTISGGHKDVAFGVREGFGDAGISIKLFAYEKGLDFISFVSEDYCLCYREKMEQDKGFLKLLDLLKGKGYTQVLSHLPGYERKNLEEVAL